VALTPGTRLGAYEITAALGAGGMGEVYKARDTRLDRTVAVKVLTGALAADSESRMRFEHEARAIAALNHPHICTIHDVGRHGDVDYLVMEYLEGETLADRIKTGGLSASPMSIDEALAIAIQIGDALDRAHRAGIVHRDLKPGNVMLVRGALSGVTAKLLDFGLAARTDPAAPGEPAPDVSMLATMAPSIVATRPPTATPTAGFSGTVPYMAPEQMDGQPADHRADVFAFGCVLYEMFAGRKAFEGATSMTVIAAIMSSDPKPIPALQSAPPVLDHLLRRCLEKDPERRWQNMGDVTGELRWIAGQPMTMPVAAPAAIRRSRVPMAAAIAVAIAALLVVVPLAMLAGVRWLRPEAAPELPTLRLEVATPPTDDPSMALSPDGTQMVFVANQNRRPMLWVRALDKVESRVLPGTEGASFPFWSPDGSTIAFFADNKLKRIGAAGGTPLVITDAPIARGGDWSRDGVILFAPGVNAPIRRVSTSGGAVESVTTLNTGSGPGHRWPQFLPDGRRFLFHSSLGTIETNGIYIGSLDKSAPVRVLQTEQAGRFVPPDTLLTVRQGALVAYKFNEGTGALEGEPTVIAQGFGTSGPGTAAVSTGGNGVLAYRAGGLQRRQLVGSIARARFCSRLLRRERISSVRPS
jgi:eukaryotic-like serine/threonine-protein kinase